MRRLRFGTAGWVGLGVVAGAVAAAIVFWPGGGPSDRVRAVVEGLRASPVYVEPGAPSVVDPVRARAVVGDRAIVVAIMNNTPPEPKEDAGGPVRAMCKDVGELVPTTAVLLFGFDEERGYHSAFCDGPDFPESPARGDFFFGVLVEAEIGWKYRATADDQNPKIEEFVLAFDANAAEEFPDGIPRRGPVPDELARGEIARSVAGMVLGTVALFLLLRLLGLAIRRGRRSAADERRRRNAAGARLNRLAHGVLHPGPATDLGVVRHQAHVAKRYLLTLRQVEEADTGSKLTMAEREIAELEREVSR